MVSKTMKAALRLSVGKLVMVEWVDAQANPHWHPPGDECDCLCKVVSFGVITDLDRERVAVTSSVGAGIGFNTANVPVSSVTKVTPLRVMEKKVVEGG